MTMKELQAMGEAELHKNLASLREQVRDLNFKIYSKEVKNNHSLKAIKKDVARILTLINQRAHGK